MKKTPRLIAIAGFLIAIALLMCACGAAKPASLSNLEVLTLTGDVLTAMDGDDYAVFTTEFSDEMLASFSEEQFSDLRSLLQETSGNYVATGELSLTNKQGHAIYRIICQYDLEEVVVTIVFKVDRDQIEGLFFDSPNLRTSAE